MNDIIKGVEPLYVVLRKVNMDKCPQILYLKHMLIIARKEVKKAFKDGFKVDHYLQIIDRRTEVYRDQDINNTGKFIFSII